MDKCAYCRVCPPTEGEEVCAHRDIPRAQLCDMVHSESARKAADKYREVVRHGRDQ